MFSWDGNERKLDNATDLERVVLAQKVGTYLTRSGGDTGDRALVEDIARVLVEDVIQDVRLSLANELRQCSELPKDIAFSIARDVELVAEPFLSETLALSDQDFAELIPELSEHLKAAVARRADIGDQTIQQLASTGGQLATSYLIRNNSITIGEPVANLVVSRFGEDTALMDLMSARKDLPLSIAGALTVLVSENCAKSLAKYYGTSEIVSKRLAARAGFEILWKQIANSQPQQIHAFVIEQKNRNKLTHDMIIFMMRKGSRDFLESAFAVLTGKNKAQVQELLSVEDKVALMSAIRETGGTPEDYIAYTRLLSQKTEAS